jgi:hypothetical protein
MSETNDGVNETPKNNEGEENEAETLSAEQIAELQAKAAKADELEADVGRLKRDLKKAEKAAEQKKTPEKNEANQSNEPDYSRLAYLEAKGFTNPDDQKAVMDEAERLKLPLTDVLNMEHMQTQLRNAADQRAAQEGMPDGKGRKGGPNKGEVEYYLAHPDEKPTDLEMANKVIEAKMKKEIDSNMFSEELYTG